MTPCFCPGETNADLRPDDPHQLPSYEIKYKKASNKKRGFDFIPRGIRQISGIDSDNYMEDYLLRIANGCSIHHTPISPESGDCGLHIRQFSESISLPFTCIDYLPLYFFHFRCQIL